MTKSLNHRPQTPLEERPTPHSLPGVWVTRTLRWTVESHVVGDKGTQIAQTDGRKTGGKKAGGARKLGVHWGALLRGGAQVPHQTLGRAAEAKETKGNRERNRPRWKPAAGVGCMRPGEAGCWQGQRSGPPSPLDPGLEARTTLLGRSRPTHEYSSQSLKQATAPIMVIVRPIKTNMLMNSFQTSGWWRSERFLADGCQRAGEGAAWDPVRGG